MIPKDAAFTFLNMVVLATWELYRAPKLGFLVRFISEISSDISARFNQWGYISDSYQDGNGATIFSGRNIMIPKEGKGNINYSAIPDGVEIYNSAVCRVAFSWAFTAAGHTRYGIAYIAIAELGASPVVDGKNNDS